MASCGFREPCPVFGSIQVLGKENIQPDLLEVSWQRDKKKNNNKTTFDKSCLLAERTKTREHVANERTSFLIKAVYEMIDKRAMSPVTSLGVYSYSLFLGISSEEMTVSDT